MLCPEDVFPPYLPLDTSPVVPEILPQEVRKNAPIVNTKENLLVWSVVAA